MGRNAKDEDVRLEQICFIDSLVSIAFLLDTKKRWTQHHCGGTWNMSSLQVCSSKCTFLRACNARWNVSRILGWIHHVHLSGKEPKESLWVRGCETWKVKFKPSSSNCEVSKKKKKLRTKLRNLYFPGCNTAWCEPQIVFASVSHEALLIVLLQPG